MASDNTDRYRQAAEQAIKQIDWCIRYLRGIGKDRIAEQIAKNRSYIKGNVTRDD